MTTTHSPYNLAQALNVARHHAAEVVQQRRALLDALALPDARGRKKDDGISGLAFEEAVSCCLQALGYEPRNAAAQPGGYEVSQYGGDFRIELEQAFTVGCTLYVRQERAESFAALGEPSRRRTLPNGDYWHLRSSRVRCEVSWGGTTRSTAQAAASIACYAEAVRVAQAVEVALEGALFMDRSDWQALAEQAAKSAEQVAAEQAAKSAEQVAAERAEIEAKREAMRLQDEQRKAEAAAREARKAARAAKAAAQAGA